MQVLYLVLVVVVLAINLLIMYTIIRVAIVHGMRRARREDWTENFDAKRAHWLTPEQRNVLAQRAPQLD